MSKENDYEAAEREILAILDDEGGFELDTIARMATVSSVLAGRFETFFWTGFYRAQGNNLIVGPYIGTVGCLQIPFGRGVCGTAAQRKETIIVPDVTKFPGHIACDSRSRSEIVVPVFDGSKELIAVLDVDSEELSAFDEIDRAGLESICAKVFARNQVLSAES
ncbi:MAG TPA: GAF domain-containing protein [Thermoanaerobaculia bacterium]|nr:GAF domain-containing protein [Thermoanaerobaculia bacterium]